MFLDVESLRETCEIRMKLWTFLLMKTSNNRSLPTLLWSKTEKETPTIENQGIMQHPLYDTEKIFPFVASVHVGKVMGYFDLLSQQVSHDIGTG